MRPWNGTYKGSKSDRNIKHGLAGEAIQSPWCLPALLYTDAQCSETQSYVACTVNSVLRTALFWLSDFPSLYRVAGDNSLEI
jgi:hypothetical protein